MVQYSVFSHLLYLSMILPTIYGEAVFYAGDTTFMS